MTQPLLTSSRGRLATLLIALALCLAMLPTASSSLAASPTIVISQIYGGGGNSGATYTHDFVELFNLSDSSVSLSGWALQYAGATGTSWQVTALSGSIPAGGYYLVQQAAGGGGTTALPTPDATGSVAMSGTNGKVALTQSSTALSGGCPTSGMVDLVGYGMADCFEGAAAAVALSNITAGLRAGAGCSDTDTNSADFSAATPSPRNAASAPAPCATTPTAPTITVEPASQSILTGTSATLSVTASGSSPLSYQWYQGLSGDASAPVGTNASSFTTPGLSASASYWVRVSNPLGAADSATATISVAPAPAACAEPATKISAIQGSGAAAAISGAVTIQGVVVGDYEGSAPNLRGFYLQEEAADQDSDPASSEGIFVFSGGADSVSLGQVVRVSGTAGEFEGQTQLSGAVTTVLCAVGASLTPTDLSMPFAAALGDVPALERFEGMLVRFPQTLYVSEHFQLGRFGQVLLSSGGRLPQPTNIALPGAAAQAVFTANSLNQILLDDELNSQNPDPIRFARGGSPLSASNTLRGGDSLTGLVGVLTYTWSGNSASGNAYRLRPLGALGGGAPDFQPANPRPATAPEVGGSLRVVGMNTLNFFVSLDQGAPICGPAANQDCRGANSSSEFTRQRAKLLAALKDLDADIVGMMELENSAGVEPLQSIVDGLNAELGAGTYGFINTGTIGSDAIRVGLIYQTAVVSPTGDFKILDSSVDPRFIDTKNRPSLAQTFTQIANGEKLTVVVNHLKSKGSDCLDVSDPDSGDGQGNCNQTRTKAAAALMDWVAGDPTASGDPDVLLIGDLNAYALEDPVRAIMAGADDLAQTSDDFSNLIGERVGSAAYSYVFSGQWGYLDHALASRHLAGQVSGVGEWHINADEPSVLDYNTEFKSAGQLASLYAADRFRTSDHDPVVVGLDLGRWSLYLPVVVR